ncbi:phage holin family protein [uncultured Planktosalinus sp.]|uniref:phage holin family protein n=1 Tax=uncultured Planktosalinus sp. TaxID=1810935 RepID=UPI0030DC6E8A
MFEKITNNVEGIQDHLESYIKNSTEYYRLDIYKKSTKTFIAILRILLLGAIALLLLFFLSLAVAFLIGEAYGNISYGLLYVAGFYLLVFIFAWIFSRKKLEKTVLKNTSKTFFND